MATVAAHRLEAPVTTWRRLHTLAVGSILVAIVAVGGLMPWAAGRHGDFEYARLAAWLATLALFLALALAKLQLLLVTIVLVLGYAVVLGHAYVDHRVVFVEALPRIDDAFVVMLAISHGGYLAKKAVPRAEPAR